MIKEIKNLADDIELSGKQRQAFITEMKEAISKIDKDDYKKFYKIANKIMNKYS